MTKEEKIINKILIADAYKYTHGMMYPEDTTNIYSILTARGSFGGYFDSFHWDRYFAETTVMEIINKWTKAVRNLESYEVEVIEVKMQMVFGSWDITHNFIDQLLDLRAYLKDNKTYKLPLIIEFASTNEYMNYQTPLITITGDENMENKFVWLVNFFETMILQSIWHFTTALTIARDLRDLCGEYQEITGATGSIILQCHDFSMRGMSSMESCKLSSKAHLRYFDSSDTIMAGGVAKSVAASEHSVMTSRGKENELDTYKELIKKFPTGVLSLVSDTWDIFNVVENILPELKLEIIQRKGKLVIRPDSGDMGKVLFGTKEQTGILDSLWKTFGGSINKKGYKELNPKVGVIVGDGMTTETIRRMLLQLAGNGWASTTLVFGVGAFTYQFNTRDTLGFAIKATAIERNNIGWSDMAKDPITDTRKKGLAGRLPVYGKLS